MDLWNNEMGRIDGSSSASNPLTAFNNRWNSGTVIKNNSTEVTVTRRQLIWHGNWYRPVR